MKTVIIDDKNFDLSDLAYESLINGLTASNNMEYVLESDYGFMLGKDISLKNKNIFLDRMSNILSMYAGSMVLMSEDKSIMDEYNSTLAKDIISSGNLADYFRKNLEYEKSNSILLNLTSDVVNYLNDLKERDKSSSQERKQ